MNGKRAKKLRRIARLLCERENIKLGDGYNHYNQAMNKIGWEPQLDDDGLPLKDPEGLPLMKPGRAPGTITTAWKYRTMVQKLKRHLRGRPI